MANFSDVRLKENIVEYTKGYNKVKSLLIVEYEWKDEQKKEEIGRVVGIIAQEVQKVLPKAVGSNKISEDDDTEYLSVSYAELIPFNWSATRILINKVESLEEKVKDYESLKISNEVLTLQVNEMMVRLEALENNHSFQI